MLEHGPFVPRGGEGSYDEFGIETPSQPFEVGDEIWFYYGGNERASRLVDLGCFRRDSTPRKPEIPTIAQNGTSPVPRHPPSRRLCFA